MVKVMSALTPMSASVAATVSTLLDTAVFSATVPVYVAAENMGGLSLMSVMVTVTLTSA